MTSPSRRTRGRIRTRLATAALIATLAGTTAGPAFADSTPPSEAPRLKAAQTPEAAQADPGEVYNTPFFFVLDGVDRKGSLFMYAPDGKGDFGPRDKIFDGDDIGDFKYLKAAAQVDNDKDGYSDATYYWTVEGVLSYTCTNADSEVKTRRIGGGWDIYTKVLSPGTIGGAEESDILAVDKAGVLWTYLARPDGTVTPQGIRPVRQAREAAREFRQLPPDVLRTSRPRIRTRAAPRLRGAALHARVRACAPALSC